MKESIQTGYDVVMSNREQFEPLVLSETDYAAYVAGLVDPRMQELPVVDFVRLENHSEIADSVVQTRLTRHRGRPAARRRNGRAGDEQSLRPRVLPERALRPRNRGRRRNRVSRWSSIERSWGPNYLQLGMEYSSASDADALFGLAASYLRTAINELGGEWRATFVIGDEPAFGVGPLSAVRRRRACISSRRTLDFGSDIFTVYEGDSAVDRGARARVAPRCSASGASCRAGPRFASG